MRARRLWGFVVVFVLVSDCGSACLDWARFKCGRLLFHKDGSSYCSNKDCGDLRYAPNHVVYCTKDGPPLGSFRVAPENLQDSSDPPVDTQEGSTEPDVL